MRPSGVYSHGLGIIGASMIIVGVSVYSTRKRVRALVNAGKLSSWLEFHIILCLVGPILVVYHTTFKAGGVAAISLWTMLSVVGSGIIGRFLYVQIPRNIRGTELTVQEINSEIDRLAAAMLASPVGVTVVRMIDEAFAGIKRPSGIGGAVATIMRLESIKRTTRRRIRELIGRSQVPAEAARQLRATASARASLLQKTLVLNQVERLFYAWHVIHLPFSIIMFLTLAAHVTVTYLLGYRWLS